MKRKRKKRVRRRWRRRLDTSKLVEDIVAASGATVAKNRNSTVLTMNPDKMRDAVKVLTSEAPEFYHLTTITGVDVGSTIDVYYHFWKGREFLSLKTNVPKENPVLDSLCDVLPSALFYEAEVKDLLGVLFKGNPMIFKGSRLLDQKFLLPDEYPAQVPPPLRKEADPEKIRKMMGLE